MTSRSDKCAVMMSYIRFIGESHRECYLLDSPAKAEKVDAHTARAYIEDHGLVLALQTEDGAIYDTPDRAFLARFKGWIKNHYDQFYRRWGL